MKKTITTITLGLLFSLSTFAAVLTVNNNTIAPGSPGQYTTIDAAFAAASAGDTLLVKGSPTVYALNPSNSGVLLINKKICIIGEGYKPKGDANLRTKVSGVFRFLSSAASGSSFWGLYGNFQMDVSNPQTVRLNNITIRRNYIEGGITLADSSYNTTIAENIINGSINLNYGPSGNNMPRHVNLKILNNIFANTNIYNTGNFYAYQIKNNLFLAGNYSNPLSTTPTIIFSGGGPSSTSNVRMQNASFENNIFYNTLPSPTNVSTNTYGPTSCSFINNITISANTNPLLSTITGNSFSGNLDNTDPAYANLFTNITANMIVSSYELFNIRISNSSPAKNAGSDGTDIGPTGGAYPIYAGVPLTEQLSGEPPLPQVRNASFTNNINAVQTGGTLQINVTGRKRN
jgi:hypothetical protein